MVVKKYRKHCFQIHFFVIKKKTHTNEHLRFRDPDEINTAQLLRDVRKQLQETPSTDTEGRAGDRRTDFIINCVRATHHSKQTTSVLVQVEQSGRFLGR